MRLLRLGEVLVVLAGSAVALLFAVIAGNATHSSDKPEWTRPCHIETSAKTNKAILKCGNYSEAADIPSNFALSKAVGAPVMCKGYRTRGWLSRIDLVCGSPT